MIAEALALFKHEEVHESTVLSALWSSDFRRTLRWFACWCLIGERERQHRLKQPCSQAALIGQAVNGQLGEFDEIDSDPVCVLDRGRHDRCALQHGCHVEPVLFVPDDEVRAFVVKVPLVKTAVAFILGFVACMTEVDATALAKCDEHFKNAPHGLDRVVERVGACDEVNSAWINSRAQVFGKCELRAKWRSDAPPPPHE